MDRLLEAPCENMKSIAITALIFLHTHVFSKCTREQLQSTINVQTQYVNDEEKVGSNHDYMDKIHIHAPGVFMGIPITAMEFTKDDVARFWIPLTFTAIEHVVQTTISGYKESTKDFAIIFHYMNQQCQRSVQTSVMSKYIAAF